MNLNLRSELAWALIVVMAAAIVSLALSLQAGLFVMFFAAVAGWTWREPWGGFTLFVVLAPILPMFKITQTIGTVTLIKDVIILALFLKLFLVPLIRRQLPYRRNILLAPIVALSVWTFVSALRADSLILGMLRARDIGLYILLYFAVLYLPHSLKCWREVFKSFTAGLVILLLLGVYQWFFAVDSAVLRFDPVREIWIPRLSSVMAHPSIFGQYLLLAAALFAAAAVFTRGQLRIWLGVLAAATLPFIFLTYSRAVWIGLVMALGAMAVAWLWTSTRKRLGVSRMNQMALGAALLLGFIFIAAMRLTPAGNYIRSAIDPTYGSNEERIEFAARLIAPLTNKEAMIGRGLGDVLAQNFREVDLEALDIAEGDVRAVQLTKNRTLVDNQWLKTGIEMGLAGLLIYSWLFWRMGRQAWEEGNIIGLWAIGFLASFIVQGLFIDIWDIFPTNAYFWIVAALVSLSAGRHIQLTQK